MNRSFFFCLAALLFAWHPHAAETNSTRAPEALIFKNGDVLYGNLLKFDSSGVAWSRPDMLNATTFNPPALAQIQFPVRNAHDSDKSNHCQVHLINDDELEGDLTEISERELILETWYAGAIKIPRESVLMIVPMAASKPPVFTGPMSLEGWVAGTVNAAAGVESGEWKFKNQAFYAAKSASIARIVGLPDTSRTEFDLVWKGFFHLAIALYTDYMQPINLISKDTEPDFGGFYSLQINNFSANLLGVKKDEPIRYLSQTVIGSLNQKSSAHFDIRVDKSHRTIALLIDGALVKTWTDTDFAGTGRGMRFVHQGQGSVKLSNIKISEWDGVFDEKPAPTRGLRQDLVQLRAGNRLAGTFLGFKDGNVNFRNGDQSTSLSLAQVRNIEFGNRGKGASKESNDVRAQFAAGGAITCKVESWEPNHVTLSSSLFGRIEANPSAFSKLEF